MYTAVYPLYITSTSSAHCPKPPQKLYSYTSVIQYTFTIHYTAIHRSTVYILYNIPLLNNVWAQ